MESQRVNRRRRRRNFPAELKVEIVDCLPLENAVHFLSNVPNRLIIHHCASRVRRILKMIDKIVIGYARTLPAPSSDGRVDLKNGHKYTPEIDIFLRYGAAHSSHFVIWGGQGIGFVGYPANFFNDLIKVDNDLKCVEYILRNKHNPGIAFKLYIIFQGDGKCYQQMTAFIMKMADVQSAYIKLVECTKAEVMAKITFAIWSASGEEMHKSEMTTKNFARGQGYTHPIIKRNSLLANNNKGNQLLPNDHLTIICNIDIYQSLSNYTGNNNSMEIRSLLTENIGNLLATKTFADCVLVTKDQKEFQAHKCVLACRSPVFAAMFKDGMIEAKTGRVKIPDIQADTLEQMLRFIYTGSAPNLEGNAIELLVAADKYQLMELKRHCEHSLAVSLDNKNACELLILADLHSATHLKSQALDFIKSHTNEVMGSAGWKTLRIDLLNQIIQSFSNQQMK